MTGLTAHTLRYYEKIGLLKGVHRGTSGYRQYAESDIAWIHFLLRLRVTGMKISDMKSFSDMRNQGEFTLSARRQLLETHQKNVITQINELMSNLKMIEEKIVTYKCMEEQKFDNSQDQERSMNMNSKERQAIIEKYVEAYNSFDVEGMISLLDKDILFRNISNGENDTETKGIQEFKELAEKSTKIFSSRRMFIINYSATEDRVEIEIDYTAILAIDLPNGLKTGEKLELKGKSGFEFKDGRISLIEDYS